MVKKAILNLILLFFVGVSFAPYFNPQAAVKGARQALLRHSQKVVIFDNTGVLVKRSTFEAVKTIGLFNLIKSTFVALPTLIKAKQELFKYMSQIPASDWALQVQKSEFASKDDNGLPLPAIFNDLHAGKVDGKFIYQQLSEMSYPNETHKSLILGIASNLLPENLAGMMNPDPNMIEVVKDLKKRGHKVVVFSNFHTSGFNILIKKYPELYGLFDEIIISSDLGDIKPLPSAYDLVAKKLGVSPQACVMIDDQLENINGAINAGMNAIHHQNAEATKNLLMRFCLI